MNGVLSENPLRVLSVVYDIFLGFLRLAQDAEFIEACRHVLYRRPLARPSDERRKANKNAIYHGSGNVCGVFRQYQRESIDTKL
jgi:hypothetical protein